MKNKDFGNRLQYLRVQRKLTQPEASKQIGLSYSAIQGHEGGGFPNRNNLQKYIDFYRCDEVWLKTGQGEPYPDGPKQPPIYKVETINHQVAAPESEYEKHGGWKPREIKVSIEIKKTIDILESDTVYATALVANINAFHQAIKTEHKLADQAAEIEILKKKCDDLIKRIAALEAAGRKTNFRGA